MAEKDKATSQSKPIDRPTVRLIVLNDRDEVLLFRLEGAGGPFWMSPGGGLEAGESYEQAARRELKEETGIEFAELGPWIWKGTDLWHAPNKTYRMIRRFYLVRLPDTPEVDISGLTGFEEKVTLDYRWWPIDEIRQSRERFSPRRMADLLTPLIAGEIPHPPIEAGPFSKLKRHSHEDVQ